LGSLRAASLALSGVFTAGSAGVVCRLIFRLFFWFRSRTIWLGHRNDSFQSHAFRVTGMGAGLADSIRALSGFELLFAQQHSGSLGLAARWATRVFARRRDGWPIESIIWKARQWTMEQPIRRDSLPGLFPDARP